MNWGEVLRREWGATTFIVTVVIGMFLVPITLALNSPASTSNNAALLPSPSPAASVTPSASASPGSTPAASASPSAAASPSAPASASPAASPAPSPTAS